MSSSPSTVDSTNTETSIVHRSISMAIILVALGDWLFWKHPVGISAALMLAAMATSVLVIHRPAMRSQRFVFSAILAALSLAPLIETISPLSLMFGTGGIAAFALIATQQFNSKWPYAFFEPALLWCIGPFRLVPDVVIRLREHGAPTVRFGGVLNWVVPIAFSAVFIALFASANPLIDQWLTAIDLRFVWNLFDVVRIAFWLVLIAAMWGIICVRRLPRWPTSPIVAQPPSPETALANSSNDIASALFGPRAVIRSLALFNVLFAVQTCLDAVFLWRGVTLPDGMSYATYAHRGAYPLMLTAALAAAFVVVTFGPNSTLKSSRLGRGLVYTWIAQNVLLVLSSILRLELYVDIYSLSYLRVAAFIWMGLVAAGLLLIILRIAFDKSNTWLVGANMIATLAVLYACCFINFASLIATYNVTHSREANGQGTKLDWHYLLSLGPSAIPAIDQGLIRLPPAPALDCDPSASACRYDQGWTRGQLLQRRNDLAASAIAIDWRGWTYRGARLTEYLHTTSGPTAP